MKHIKNWLLALIFATSVGGTVFAALSPQTVAAECTNGNILTIPPWYDGLTVEDESGNCVIESPEVKGLSAFIWTIVLNVIEIMLQLVGYIAVAFILYGGFLFLTSGGSAEGAVKARKSILNAVIGLAISVSAVIIVNLVSGAIST